MKTSKIFLALLALVLVVSLVACGGKEPEVTEPAATTTEAAATTTEAPATTTAAPVVTTTAAPATTTKAPATTTKAPATTTKAPAATETPTEVAYKSGISTALTEGKNADGKKIFNADEIFANTVKFQSSTKEVWDNAKDGAKAQTSAEIAVAWDGEFIYAFIEVTDPTITSKGQAWVNETANADLFYNDSFEFYYCFGAAPDKNTRKIVKMDAYGYKKFAGTNEGSVFFDEIEAVGNYSTEAGKYYIVFKIPAKAEDGTPLKAGDTVYFSEQINDIRDASDVTTKKVYCSGANRQYADWVSFTLDAAGAGAGTGVEVVDSTKVSYKEGISTELTAKGNEFVADEIFDKTVKFQSSTKEVWDNAKDGAKAQTSAEIAVAWDGAYVYAYVEVTDPTITSKGQAWIDSTANADLFYNDSFEFYYCFGAQPSSSTRRIVKMDAYGLVKFAGNNEGSVFFDEIEAVGNYSTEAGKYYIVFKIPAKAEDGTALKAGDTVYFSEQINDIRDASDVTTKKVYCSGANRQYADWVSFELIGK